MKKKSRAARTPAVEMASALELDQQLCFALYRASRAIVRSYGPILEPLGLTYPQYLVLLVLWEGDGILVKDIGNRLVLDSATLTPLLKRLEQKSLISRNRDEIDERKVYIKLTVAGKKMKDRAVSIPMALACSLGVEPCIESNLTALISLRSSLFELADRLEKSVD